MKEMTVRGTIDRRMLINFRVEPSVLENVIPSPFRLKLIHGKAIAGICLLRLKNVRPPFMPAYVGIGSENVAHRIAVEWDEGGAVRSGVYIPRRDSASPFNVLAGGRIFPGVHHPASFEVFERNDYFRVGVKSRDNETRIEVEATLADDLPLTSTFNSLEEVSQFFKQGGIGYSPAYQQNRLEGLELHSYTWKMEALAVSKVESSYFSNLAMFPSGTIEFDSALLMRNIEHEWRRCPSLYSQPMKQAVSY